MLKKERKARAPKVMRHPTTYAWNPRVACRTLEGSAFVLVNSTMVRLNEVGSFIWERFAEPATLASVVEAVVTEFATTAAEARRDAEAFVAALVEKQALVSVDTRSEVGRSK